MKKRFWIIMLSILMVTIAMAALSACSDVEKLVYNTPENISYDGQYITWDRTTTSLGTSADYYFITINGGAKQRSNSTTYPYSSSETFEVTVVAVFGEDEKSSASVTFKPLTAIEKVFIADDGTISWNAVSGANAYALTLNGKDVTTTDTHYELPAGSNRIKVKPIVTGDPSFYSLWSEEVKATIYSMPTNIRFDGTTISWIGNATQYLVNINGVQAQTVDGNLYHFNSEHEDFVVEIKAVGNHTNTFDSKPATEEFHYLTAVTDLNVENGVLKWSAIANAEGYKIKIGDVEQKEILTQPQYEKLASGRSLDISVMPINNSGNYFSSWSAVKTIYIIETPVIMWSNDIALDGESNQNITWDPVNVAAGYTIRVSKNGEKISETPVGANQLFYANDYADVGIYTIEVKANADLTDGNYYDSQYSKPITIERLSAPKRATNNFIVSDPNNLDRGFTVNFIGVNGATYYQLYKDDVLLDGKQTTGTSISEYNIIGEGEIAGNEYTYKVRSMGGVRSIQGKTYVTLPCLKLNALTFNITVLPTPQNLAMNGFALSWNNVIGNNNYNVYYAGTTVTATSNNIDLSILEAGNYDVSVSTRGNGSDVLPSNVSSPMIIRRLEYPRNIKITSEGNGTLEFDTNAIDGVKEDYTAYLNNSENELGEDQFSNMYQFITSTAGTVLSMQTKANVMVNNIYYMTSQKSPVQQFIRLAAPVFPEGALSNSVQIKWNAPSNINTAEYTPTYRLTSVNDGVVYGGGNINTTVFDIDFLEGGISYGFSVKAIGNSTKYLDSAESEVLSAYKLSAPNVIRENGKYVWNSVVNATSYIVKIDGKKVSDEYYIPGVKHSVIPLFDSRGVHNVTFQAIGDGKSTLNSKEYLLEQQVEILNAPKFAFRYSDDVVKKGGKIIVDITEVSPNCWGYEYEIAGITQKSQDTSCNKVMESTGTFRIKVKAVGGIFDANNVFYIDSPYAGGNSAYEITLLGVPDLQNKPTSDGIFMWRPVAGALGYDYQIAYDNEEYGEIHHISGTQTPANVDYKKHKIIKIRVKASGNGNNVVASEWIEITWVNPN